MKRASAGTRFRRQLRPFRARRIVYGFVGCARLPYAEQSSPRRGSEIALVRGKSRVAGTKAGMPSPPRKTSFDFAVFIRGLRGSRQKKSVPAKRVAGTLFFKLQALNFKLFSPYFFGIAGRDAAAIAWPWRLDFSSGTTRLIFSSGNSALRTSFALSMMIVPPSPEVTRPMMSRFS